jgi:DNA-binding response OmpR family regulator
MDEGFAVEHARSPEQVLTLAQAHDFDVVLLDLNYARDTTSGARGSTSCSSCRRSTPRSPWS